MIFELCDRPHCGGWMKEIVTPDNKIEKICSKCAYPPDARSRRRVEEGKRRHIEFDALFRAIWREKAYVYRTQKKLKEGRP